MCPAVPDKSRIVAEIIGFDPRYVVQDLLTVKYKYYGVQRNAYQQAGNVDEVFFPK